MVSSNLQDTWLSNFIGQNGCTGILATEPVYKPMFFLSSTEPNVSIYDHHWIAGVYIYIYIFIYIYLYIHARGPMFTDTHEC